MELKGKVINFLGDSITLGAKATKPENIYYEVIKQKYGLKAANGYGVGGTCIAPQHVPSKIPDYDRDFISRVDEMDINADIVVVFGGTNDFGHGDAPFGNLDDNDSSTFCGSVHVLFEKLIGRYPGKPIIIVTPLHRVGEDNPRGATGCKPKDYAPLKTYVDAIREIAQYYSLPVCDLFRNSGLQPNVPIIKEKFIQDGLHPNDEGHRIVAERIANFILSL